MTGHKAITEITASEGPNDSVTANSFRSRKFTAAFPVSPSPMFGGSLADSGTQSRKARNTSTLHSVGDSGTVVSNASRSLRQRRHTVDTGYTDQKISGKPAKKAVAKKESVTAISFTSKDGRQDRQRNVDSATFKPKSTSSAAHGAEANFTVSHSSIAHDSIKDMDPKAKIKAERRARMPTDMGSDMRMREPNFERSYGREKDMQMQEQ